MIEVLKTKPCDDCGEIITVKRVKTINRCEACRKKARVRDTYRWQDRRDAKSLANIDPKYTRRYT